MAARSARLRGRYHVGGQQYLFERRRHIGFAFSSAEVRVRARVPVHGVRHPLAPEAKPRQQAHRGTAALAIDQWISGQQQQQQQPKRIATVNGGHDTIAILQLAEFVARSWGEARFQ